MARVSTELQIASIEEIHTGIAVLLLTDLLEMLVDNIDGYVAFNDPGCLHFDFLELLRWVSVLLCSSFLLITVEKSLKNLSHRDCNVLNKKP